MRYTFYVLLSLFFSHTLAAHPIERALRAERPSLNALVAAIACDPHPGFINANQESYLHLAAKRNLGKGIQLLMAIPQIQTLLFLANNGKQTALEITIIHNRDRAFAALLPHYKNVGAFRMPNKHRWSLLHLAAFHNRPGMIQALIAAGHPVNVQDKTSWSALDVAQYFNRQKAMRVLQKYGAFSTMSIDEKLKLVARVKDDIIVHEDREEPLRITAHHLVTLLDDSDSDTASESEEEEPEEDVPVCGPGVRELAYCACAVGVALLAPRICQVISL